MKLALIGEKLSHSYSAYLHNKLGSEYSLVELAECDLEDFVKSNDFDGYNVTIPYKEKIMAYLDEISPEAEKIGAVNTVLKRNGKNIGRNTDIMGMTTAFSEAGIDVEGKSVMILGTGGTAKTAELLCERMEAEEIFFVSRTGTINYKNYQQYSRCSVIINTTPVGMYPNFAPSPISLDCFKKLEAVFDAIYNPLETDLILQARKRGVIAENGLKMLAAQAKFSHDLFAGEISPNEKIKELYSGLFDSVQNIVLVGMPSSGKTTVGRLLAERLGKEFFDSDEYIIEKEGKAIDKIFAEKGEGYFRKVESDAIRELTAKGGIVLAVGGGAVIKEDNRKLMKRNAKVVALTRPIEMLSLAGRPLSKSHAALERMEKERKPFYDAVADFFMENIGSPERCAEKIAERLK